MNVPNTRTSRRTGIRIGVLAGLAAIGLLSSHGAFAQALQAPNNLSDVGNATTSIQNLFHGQIIGVQPEAFGAQRDGVSNDTRWFVDAANYAAMNRRGLILSSGGNYQITPLQFGGSATASASFTGSISGTTLSVTSTPLGRLTPGQSLTCTGCAAGTIITAHGLKAGGWIGTYTVSPSQTVGSTTITAAAPVFTASISGTTMTVTAVSNGQLNLVDSLVSVGTIPGTTIVSQTSGSTGGTGTYTVSYSQTVASQSFSAYPLTVVPLPDSILGAPGGETATVLSGFGVANSATPLIEIVDPPAIGAVLGLEVGNFRISANSIYRSAIQFHGFAATSAGGVAYAHDITASGATGSTCGVNVVGNAPGGVSWGVIEASFARISSVGNTRCDFNFDGNNGDGSHNVQSVYLDSLKANSSSSDNGFDVNFAELTCIECLSQNHTGLPISFDNVYHNVWTNFYSEANGGAVTGTSNSLGVHITGKVQEGINATLLACATCDIDVATGSGVGTVSRNFGVTTGIGITLGNDGIGTTSTPALTLSNAAAATSTVQQWSPAQRFSGNGWDTGSGSSKRVDWKVENQTFSTGTGPVGYLVWSYQVNGAGYTSVGYLSPAGFTLTSADLFMDANRAVRIGAGGDNAITGDGSSFIRVGTSAARDLQLYAGGGGAQRMTIDNATGNVGIGTASPATAQSGSRNLTVNGSVQTARNTVANLPTCNANTEGSRYGVTDASSPTFLGVIAGGGSVHAPVYCNGTNWVAN
jgi:hypothetical protein